MEATISRDIGEFMKCFGDCLTDSQRVLVSGISPVAKVDFEVVFRDESFKLYADLRTKITLEVQHPEYETTIVMYVKL